MWLRVVAASVVSFVKQLISVRCLYWVFSVAEFSADEEGDGTSETSPSAKRSGPPK